MKKSIFLAIAGIMLVIGTTGSIFAQTPPPLPDSATEGYFVNLNGQSTGPYDVNGLKELINSGQLTRNSLVWKEGMEGWLIAGLVQELDPLFTVTAPPPVTEAPPPVSAPPSSALPPDSQPEYKDFHAGHRWGTFWLNSLFPGLGSFTVMRDTAGGLWQLGASGVGTILTSVGLVSALEGEFDEDAAIAITVGVVFYGFSGIFNIVRSAAYHRPRPKTASFLDPERWQVVIVPGKDGIEAVALGYTLHF